MPANPGPTVFVLDRNAPDHTPSTALKKIPFSISFPGLSNYRLTNSGPRHFTGSLRSPTVSFVQPVGSFINGTLQPFISLATPMEDRDGAFKELEPMGEIDGADALLASKRYSCFCFPCFGTRRSASDELSWWERAKAKAKSTKFDADGHWWSGGIRSLKKLREWSEIVAGPRWKTFIRRFNRNRPATVKLGKFQYDPISYALNFDEGHNGDADFEGDEYSGGFQNFSDRLAAVNTPAKSSAAAVAG